MKSLASGVALALALASCHTNKPAETVENSAETEPSSSANASESSGSSLLDNASGGPRAEKATVVDDTAEKEAPCSGPVISDLMASLSKASCEVPPNAPAPAQAPTKDSLDVMASADHTIAPGAMGKVTVIFRNKGKAPLPLDFTVDPEAHFAVELYTPKGARVDLPAGKEPPLPSQAADSEAAEPHTARVTLSPNGTATLVLPWQAVKYKWASKEKAKGAVAGRGYPREPSGPLPKGKYVLHVVTPLAHIEEGSEHELSQPRVAIDVGGSAVPEPSAASPAASKKVPKAPAPAPTDSVEARFLKVTGATPPASAKKH
jgi:hypothetical protein